MNGFGKKQWRRSCLLGVVFRRERDSSGFILSIPEDVDRRWSSMERQVDKLHIRWDAEKVCYTFADGSRLPEPPRKIYQRRFWHLNLRHGGPTLILERTDERYVAVSLEWEGATLRNEFLEVFRVEDDLNRGQSLYRIPMAGPGGDNLYNTVLDLRAGPRVQARLVAGKREWVSPVFTP